MADFKDFPGAILLVDHQSLEECDPVLVEFGFENARKMAREKNCPVVVQAIMGEVCCYQFTSDWAGPYGADTEAPMHLHGVPFQVMAA